MRGIVGTSVACLVGFALMLSGCGSSSSQPAKPTTAPRPAAEHGLPDVSSTGILDSAQFTIASTEWTVHYSFDCGEVTGSEPDAQPGQGKDSKTHPKQTPDINSKQADKAALAKEHFNLVVLGAGNTRNIGALVDRHAKDGQGVAHVHGSGQYYLRMLTDCHYHVRVSA